MKVLKFGGTSVGTVESLSNVKAIVDSLAEPAIVVVSALGGLTDRLIATAHDAAEGRSDFLQNLREMERRHYDIINTLVPIRRRNEVTRIVAELFSQLVDLYTGLSLIRDLPERILARVVSFGERMSSVIVSEILENAEHHDSLEFMKTEKWFDKNIADRELTESLIKATFPLPLKRTVVTGGFISRDRDTNEITNLGRGGSDYTAALIAAALNADLLDIWTDVDGFMTADPRIIPDARVIDEMTFTESMELCSFGAKVIYPPTIYPVFHKNIPIRILNTHNPSAPGTLITESAPKQDTVRGVSALKNSSMVSIISSPNAVTSEYAARANNALAKNGISIFAVTPVEHPDALAFAMPQEYADKAEKILNEEFMPEIQNGEIVSIGAEKKLVVLAVVRDDIRSIAGLADGIRAQLAEAKISLRAYSAGASDTTMAFLTDIDDADTALRIIHNYCFSEKP